MFADLFPELVLISCTHRQIANSTKEALTQHSHVVLEYCFSGKGILTVRGTAFPIESGQCFGIMPNTPYRLSLNGSEPWNSIRIEVTGTQVASLLTMAGATNANPILPWRGERKMRDHFLLLAKYADCRRPADILGNLSVLYGLFGGLIILNSDPSQRTLPAHTEDPIFDAIEYIKKNYTKPLTVHELTEYVSLNRSYFSSLFRKRTGLSPQQFFVRWRLWIACGRLDLHDSSITQIANSVGYEYMIFSQAMRRTLGLSPTEYRALPSEEKQILRQKLGVADYI